MKLVEFDEKRQNQSVLPIPTFTFAPLLFIIYYSFPFLVWNFYGSRISWHNLFSSGLYRIHDLPDTRFPHPRIVVFYPNRCTQYKTTNLSNKRKTRPKPKNCVCMLCYVKRCLPQIWGVVCYRQMKLVVVRQFNEFTANSVTRRICKLASAQVQILYSWCPDQRLPWHHFLNELLSFWN